MDMPTEYRAGFAKARALDAEMAERYVRHTMLGDAMADAAIAACQGAPAGQQRAWLQDGIQRGPSAIPGAPDALRELLAEAARVPDWFDPAQTRAGCRAFHGNSEMFIGAFVGAVLIEGFSTLISKSFSATGRLVDQGTRRLKQNNRHLSEIFIPGGLEREGEGWMLSVRIRLMHARVRFLLERSDEWDAAACGVPLSSAHVGFATAAFSGLLLARARMLGVSLKAEERASFMLVWRYSGHLMGVHPELQAATEDEALRLHRIGAMCEPPPDIEAILLANGLINSAPIVAGITDAAERKALVRRIYTVSRALIGDGLADQLNFPPARGFGTLAALRLRNRLDRVLRRALPGFDRRRRAGQFGRMLDLSFHGDGEISYRMPQHLHAEKDAPP
jgi:hypothetical protein